MKKQQRVLKSTEFSQMISRRKSFSSPGFVLYVQPRKEEHARVGISVGKKLGNAVVRTRTKRQVRALIDSVYTFDEPFDSILIVRPPFLKMEYSERKEMLSRLHDRALKKSGGPNEKNTS